MLRLRFTWAPAVAAFFCLWGGPAWAAFTQPTGGPTARPLVRRAAPLRPGATKAAASRPGGAQLQPTTLVALGKPATDQPPVLLVAAAPAAAPQRLLYLTGTVLDPAGRPCPGVCVFPTTNPRDIAVTNAQGDFQLQVLTHTTLNLQAEYVGLGSSRVALPDCLGQPVRIVLGR